MQRRTFLALLGGSMGLTAMIPPVLARMGRADGPHPHESDVASELELARHLGKPLLVLVDPVGARPPAAHEHLWMREHGALLWERQTTLGAWLNSSNRDSMAAIALCHVTTARLDELAPFVTVRASATPAERPWLVLVETSPGAANVHASTGKLPEFEAISEQQPGEQFKHWAERRNATQERSMRRRMATLDAWLEELLSQRPLTQRAEQVAASLTGAQTAELIAARSGAHPLDDEQIFRAGALLLSQAHGEQERLVVSQALAAGAIQRWREAAPRGAHWGMAGGCGSRIACDLPPESEGEQVVIGCGMGHVPKLSRRFLSLFADHG